MIIDRKWAMPSKNTFSIKPIKEFINEEIKKGVIIDPFANISKIANITNDIDPQYDTDYNLEALDFLKLFKTESVDTVLNDPPYSVRQLSEVYKKVNLSVTMETTSSKYWSNLRKEISRVVKPGGKVISCSWNSNGIGKRNGFKITRIRIIAHGGIHNDTIIMSETKIQKRLNFNR